MEGEKSPSYPYFKKGRLMAKWTQEQKDAAKKAYAKRIASSKEIEVTPVKEVEEVKEEVKPMGMEMEHKLQSMTNAIKILPPNMIKDGRHLKENIQAICGFMVLDEMMDEVYKDFVHPNYT